MPRLHELKLHESPVLEGNNYERFSFQWLLVVSSNPSIDVAPGDVIYIPELLTGAGEFEGIRFVGIPTDQDNQGECTDTKFPLIKGGIEYPEFPAEVRSQHSGSLRVFYNSIFDTVLAMQLGGPNSLKELMGDDDNAVDEFWGNPPICRPPRQENERRWEIPLSKCQARSLPTATGT